MKTTVTSKSQIKRSWHLIDLDNQILGRKASEIAELLIGKHKIYFTRGIDCGDYVVVLNSEKVAVTGRKYDQKMYRRHSGYPGGFRELSFKQQMEKDPRQIIITAVKNMLPKNKLRAQRLKRLKVFTGVNHPYADKLK